MSKCFGEVHASNHTQNYFAQAFINRGKQLENGNATVGDGCSAGFQCSKNGLNLSGVPSHDNFARMQFGSGTLATERTQEHALNNLSNLMMPIIGGNEEYVFQQTQGSEAQSTGGTTTGGATTGGTTGGPSTTTESCGQPRSMNKNVSTTFLGGLTMDSYFPDLSGQGYWDHANTGGPFTTSHQAGGNAQLYGVVPSPCIPSQYRLEQTANPVRYRIGGRPDPLEGTTFDDIARSTRDFTRPPSRQEFLGGGDAPLGRIISMADPPSVAYGAGVPDVERDTNFVSSLVGPGGRQSVRWSQSVRTSGGAVTTNTLT